MHLGSILGLDLFNTFADHLEEGLNTTLIAFTDGTKLDCVVNTEEDIIQKDIERLEIWAGSKTSHPGNI